MRYRPRGGCASGVASKGSRKATRKSRHTSADSEKVKKKTSSGVQVNCPPKQSLNGLACNFYREVEECRGYIPPWFVRQHKLGVHVFSYEKTKESRLKAMLVRVQYLAVRHGLPIVHLGDGYEAWKSCLAAQIRVDKRWYQIGTNEERITAPSSRVVSRLGPRLLRKQPLRKNAVATPKGVL